MDRKKRKPKLTRKLQSGRKALVMYRDKTGNWHITGHSTLQYAINHCERVVTLGKTTKALLCYILYEESVNPNG